MNSHGVEYLLVGGYAVNYHGYHRTTGDMDVLIAVNPVNAEKVTAVVRAFGFPHAMPGLFLNPGKMTRMYPEPYRIELLTRIQGVTFEACYAKRIEASVDGVLVPIIDLENLLANKRAAGRLKDQADVEALQKLHHLEARRGRRSGGQDATSEA